MRPDMRKRTGYTAPGVLWLAAAGAAVVLTPADFVWRLVALALLVLLAFAGPLLMLSVFGLLAPMTYKLWVEVEDRPYPPGAPLPVHLHLQARRRLTYIGGSVKLSAARHTAHADEHCECCGEGDTLAEVGVTLTDQGTLQRGEAWDKTVTLTVPEDAPASGESEHGTVTWTVWAEVFVCGFPFEAVDYATVTIAPVGVMAEAQEG